MSPLGKPRGLRHCFAHLPVRQQFTWLARVGLLGPVPTPGQLAEAWGISRQAVLQDERRAHAALRDPDVLCPTCIAPALEEARGRGRLILRQRVQLRGESAMAQRLGMRTSALRMLVAGRTAPSLTLLRELGVLRWQSAP